MPTPIPSQQKPDLDRHNPGNTHWSNDTFAGRNNYAGSGDHSQSSTAQDLQSRENSGSGSSSRSNASGTGATGSDYANSVRGQEGAPGGGWNTNVSPANTAASSKSTSLFGKVRGTITGARNKPLITLAIMMFGGGSFLAMTPANFASLSLSHWLQNSVIKWDSQSTSFEKRAHKIMYQRIEGKATGGICSTLRVCQRYGRLSKYMIKRFEKNRRIEALKDGKVIKSEDVGLLGVKPDQLRITRSDGTKKVIDSPDFRKNFFQDTEVRSIIHEVYAPRWVVFSDKVAANLRKKWKLTKKDRLAEAKNKKQVDEGIDNAVKGKEVKGKYEAKESDEEGKEKITEDTDIGNEAKKIAGEGAEGASKSVSKEAAVKLIKEGVGKNGNIAAMLAGGLCMVQDGAQSISKTIRAIQMEQVIQFATLFATAADHARAGTNNPIPMAELGAKFMATRVNKEGKITKRSAPESHGYKQIMYNDLVSSATSNWTQYVPGGGWARKMNSLANALGANIGILKTSCTGINSSAGQLLLSVAGGWTSIVGQLVSEMAAPVISSIMAPILGKLINTMAGTLVDSSTIGEDAGDAMSSGILHMFSESAAAGGNGVLTTDQTIAYKREAAKLNLAYAQEYRLNHSPFDISSPYTFMGSIYSSFIPYMSSFSSLGNFTNSVLSLSKNIFPALLGTQAYAEDDKVAKIWNSCDDPNLKGVGAESFCSVSRGALDLDKDPSEVADALAGQYNEETGEATGGTLKEWQEKCGSGTGENGVDVSYCKFDSEEKKLAALFTIDQRVVDTMDNPPVDDGGSNSQGQQQSQGGSLPSGDAKSLAQQILDSQNITVADYGWNSGETTPKSQIENTAKGQPAIPDSVPTQYSRNVDPQILQVILLIGQKHKITVSSLMRTQMTAGGYSQHPRGRAVDLSPIGSCGDGAGEECAQAVQELINANALPQGGGIGQSTCGGARGALNNAITQKGWQSFDDSCNHLHIDLGQGNAAS